MKPPIVLSAVAALVLAACSDPAEPPRQPAAAPVAEAPPAPVTSTASVDRWVGRWAGPEGLFLEIRPKDASGAYPLTLKDNLDTQGEYLAEPSGQGLAFHRGDDAVTVRAGTGAETGFKHLADKRDCLIVIAGQEGYCRD